MPYYTPTGNPIEQTRGVSAQVRNEFLLIQSGFNLTETAIAARGLIAGQVWTGAHDFTGATITVATQTAGDNTANSASTAFVTDAVASEAATRAAADALLAPINNAALTGTPTAPTAPSGTSTTQLATTAFVMAQAFSAALPGQTGNAGKFVTTDGTSASWAEIPPANQLPILALGII